MKMLKNSVLLILLSMFVVFQGFCDTPSDWVESQYTFGKETFVISFPGVPEQTIAPDGDLNLNYSLSNSNFQFTVSSISLRQQLSGIKFLTEKLIENSFDAILIDNRKRMIRATKYGSQIKFFIRSSLYMLACEGSLEDMRRFLDSFRIVENRE